MQSPPSEIDTIIPLSEIDTIIDGGGGGEVTLLKIWYENVNVDDMNMMMTWICEYDDDMNMNMYALGGAPPYILLMVK